MKKLRLKVRCSKCKLIRFVTQYPENGTERAAMRVELYSVPYVCSDHATLFAGPSRQHIKKPNTP